MMNIETLRTFLGWSLVLNSVVLLLSTVVLVRLGDWTSRVHAKMFKVDEDWVRKSYFTYLANYKIAVIVLNLVPWVATFLMSR